MKIFFLLFTICIIPVSLCEEVENSIQWDAELDDKFFLDNENRETKEG